MVRVPPAWQKVLRRFFRTREVVRKALGTHRYLVNPKRCLCPFINTRKKSGCREGQGSGTYELNSLNDLANLRKVRTSWDPS